MPKFAANISMMFQELDFLDRFAAAAKAGFKGVEYLFPYAFDAREIAERLHASGLQQVLFNLPPGDWDNGERGLGAIPGREAELADGLETALAYAQTLGCPRLHIMAGIPPADVPTEECRAVFVENLKKAARRAAEQDIVVQIEPINTRDIPGYFLNYPEQARTIIEDVGAANLKLQFDLYHCQIMCGDLAMNTGKYLALASHVQIAGVPGRHEPDVGEVNYPYLFDLLDELGYQGWIGCEYKPRGDTLKGLDWFHRATGQAH